MVISNAEAQRRWRERQKAKKVEGLKSAEGSELASIFRSPFYEWFEGQGTDFQMTLDIAGIDPPSIDDDSDPKSATGEIEQIFIDGGNSDDSPYKRGGSLARGEIMVGGLISAAVELAGIINRYKKEEITSRIAEIEQSDLLDPAARKQALADIVRLQKMLDQLDKQVRWTFPQWKVTGE